MLVLLLLVVVIGCGGAGGRVAVGRGRVERAVRRRRHHGRRLAVRGGHRGR